MNRNAIEFIINNSATIKMLRSKNAVLIVSFLYAQFQLKNEIAIPNTTLIQKLADYLDELNYEDQEEHLDLSSLSMDSTDKAKNYINKWTDENYLRNYFDESTKQVMNVLTKHSSKAFQILELLKEKELVGIESKLKDIFYKLKELIDNTTDDPVKRIEELEKQKEKIDEEIRKIQREGFVKTYEKYQIKTRFEDINKITNELIGDFKEVEDNFKKIIRDIYEKQLNKSNTKGKILQYTFDSLNELKQSEQGKSFYAFWNFLIDNDRKDELKFLTDEIYKILDEREIDYNDKFLRKLKNILYFTSNKVLETNNLLADKLTRIIAEKEVQNRKQTRETINEIKNLAFQLVDKEIDTNIGMEIEGEPYINLSMEKKPVFEDVVVSEYSQKPKTAQNILDVNALSSLVDTNQIREEQLLKNIQLMLNERKQISLSEVVEKFPISKGLAEILKYISLVQKNNKFFVNHNEMEYLLFDTENQKYLKTPQIIYSK